MRNRRSLVMGPVVALAVAMVVGAAPTQAAPRATLGLHPFYLSLGDSLSRGVQPDADGRSVMTDQGYADDLFQLEQPNFKRLQKVLLGCPGESTGTMINGGICAYPLGSQLAQAVNFLRHHRKNTVFVTIDIGANNVDGCISDGQVDLPCVTAGLDAMKADMPVIVSRLNAAAGPHAAIQFVGMRYYDPYLASWLAGPDGQAISSQSLLLTNIINAVLQNTYLAGGWKVANVSFAFQTNDTTDMVVFPPFGEVPVDVANICLNTWMCAATPQGPNIHANALGYMLIAQVFAAQIAT
jgi:lysophospholipase L1-like esterase